MTVCIDDYADDPHRMIVADITFLTLAATRIVEVIDAIDACRRLSYRAYPVLKAARDSLLTDEARDMVATAIRLTRDSGGGPPHDLEALARRLDPDWDARNSTSPTTAREF